MPRRDGAVHTAFAAGVLFAVRGCRARESEWWWVPFAGSFGLVVVAEYIQSP